MTAILDPKQKQKIPVFILDKTEEDAALDHLELLIGEPEALEAWPQHSQTALEAIKKVSEDRRRVVLYERFTGILDRQERFILQYKANLATEIAKKATSIMGDTNHAE